MTSSPIPTYRWPDLGQISDAVIADYHEAGVVVFEDFASDEACDQLRARARRLMEGFDPAESLSVFSTASESHQGDRYFLESGDKIRFFFESGAFDDDGRLVSDAEAGLNKIGHALHDLDPVFEAFSYRPELGRMAHDLGLADPAIVQSMYILKPPRIGGEVHWHQDSTYIYTEPDSCTGFWFALEDATTENGCMHFLPGHHKGSLRERNVRTQQFATHTERLDATPFPEHLGVAVPARKGTLVVFHGRAPHASAPNRSDHSRHAYTLHVIDQTSTYPDTNWLQRSADMPLRSLLVPNP